MIIMLKNYKKIKKTEDFFNINRLAIHMQIQMGVRNMIKLILLNNMKIQNMYNLEINIIKINTLFKIKRLMKFTKKSRIYYLVHFIQKIIKKIS